MEIKLFTGATTYEAGINTLKQIDVNDFSMQNIVVVPDSFSMQAENLIFDVLKIKTTFNVEVVGISRLAGKILRNNNIEYKRISNLEEVFLIYKAVKECEGEFKYFNKCGVDFCLKLLQIIKQFKSCNVKPEQIKTVGDILLDNKMHDLKLLYIKYQSLLGEKMDLSELLDFFIENAQNKFDCSKINMFFVNFDSFSLEINSFICRLAKLVNKVCIGMARACTVNNAYIFENDIFNKTTALAKEYGIPISVQGVPTEITGERLAVVKNLFGFNLEKYESDYFLNVSARNKRDEVEFVAKYIKREVFKGRKFKNFAVAVANPNYYSLIKDVFDFYGIFSYCDEAVSLSETILARFIFKMFEIAKMGFNRQQFEYIVSSPLIEPSEKVLNDLFLFDINSEDEFLAQTPQYSNIVFLIKQLSHCKTASNYSQTIKEILELINTRYVSFLSMLEEKKQFKEHSENSQAKELIFKVLEKLAELGAEEHFSIFDEEQILKLAFDSVKVETIPAYVDAVFVGDATTSYFEDVDFLFVVGATANALPKQQSDIGLIDDDDIKKLKLNFVLEPEIKVLNRRSRLKLFELFQHATKKLIVCHPVNEEGKQSEPAQFVTELLKIFGNKTIHTVALEHYNLGVNSSDEELERFLFNVGCKKNILVYYSKFKEQMPRNLIGTVKNLLKNEIPRVEAYEYVNEVDMIPKKIVSASQLETYFTCPFKHFIQHVLKVKQKENLLPNKRLFGIFQHALLKTFIEENENIDNISVVELERFLNENVEKVASQIYNENIIKKEKVLTYLNRESKIILKNVIKEQKYSKFRPFLLEDKILEDFYEDIKLIGFVDRADKVGEDFRIIDYKTGNTDSLRKDLFYGKKLQLFLYADAIKKKTNLRCVGVYYFDCQTKYTKLNSKQNLLNGMTLKENEIVELTDKRLLNDEFKSDIVGMTRKKNVKEGEFAFKFGNSVERFEDLFDYANKISVQALTEIQQGYIKPKPFKESCEFCPFMAICKHSEADGFRKILKEKIKQ